MGVLYRAGATAAAVTLIAGMASATTLTFDSIPQDGFNVSPLTTDMSENCPTAGDSCMSLSNGSGDSVLTYAGGAFNLAGFDFRLAEGSVGNTLKVMANFADGTSLTKIYNAASGFLRNTTYSVPLDLMALTSVSFSHDGSATAKVDNIGATPNVVPLPMTGLLLGTAFLGFGVLRRRRNVAV